MRRLMWIAIGFGTGCGLAVWLLPRALLIPLGAVTVAAGILPLCLGRKLPLKVLGLLLLGLGVSLCWFRGYDSRKLAPVRALDGQTLELTLELTDYSWENTYGIAVDARVQLDSGPCRVRAYLDKMDPLEPGDRVTGTFRLRYTGLGGAREATYHSSSGILLLAYPRGEHIAETGDRTALRHLPARLRQEILSLLDRSFPSDTQPFVRALLLGDTSRLDYATDSALSLSGLRHIAAVSGLHLSILFSMLYFLTRKNRWGTLLLGLPLLVLFSAMAGFTPSIVRSAIMQLLMILATVFRREYDPPTALGFAALTMLAADPLTVTSVGFQLSVASVAGIFLFGQRINGWLMDPRRLGRWKLGTLKSRLAAWFSGSVGISLGALVLTSPLCALHFGSVNLLSVLTNLLCLWVVTLVFCGSAAACVLCALWPAVGSALGWLLSWPVRYVLAVARLVARFPLSAVYTHSPYIVAWLVFVYALLALFLLSRKKQPLILGVCAALGLCLALGASWTEPLLDECRVTLLDVGQGQCVLLQSGGKTYMVDCGGNHDESTADIAAGALLSQGITSLDGLILTHYDKDHVGAAQYLLQRIPTDVLILPQGSWAKQWDPGLLAYHKGPVFREEEELEIVWEGAKLTVFPSWNLNSTNESSMCVLFQTENCDILITGDRGITGEEMLLRTADIPQLDALVVGHHGAHSSTGKALLEATRPQFALISVGADNIYNHPSQRVLEDLAAFGCTVRRTDLEGTVIFRR